MNIHLEKIISAISLFCELCIAYHVRKENSTFGDTLISLLLMIPVIAMMLPVTVPVFWLMNVSLPFPAACLISLAGMATAGFILMLKVLGFIIF